MLQYWLRTPNRAERRPGRRRLSTPQTLRRARLWLEQVEDRVCLSTVTLNTLQTGWWDGTGSHTAANTNYVTGQIGGLGYRNFAVFDLTAISLPIVGAQLRLFNPTNPPGFGYQSPDPTETYTLFDISTPIAELRANGAGRVDIYNDLGTGAEFGSRVVSAADNGQLVATPVNAAGVAALNAARGQLAALGGGLTTLAGAADQFVFGFTGGGQRDLVLELQDPAGPIVIGQAPFPSQLGPVSSFRVYFDREINPATFTPSDATLSGWQGNIPIMGVALVPNTGGTAFDVSFAPQGVTTTYVFTVGPDIRDTNGNLMDQNVDFIPGQEDDFFIGSFGIQGPRVVSSNPSNGGSTRPPLTRVTVTFNTAMNPLEFDAGDVASFYGPLGLISVASVTPANPGNTMFNIDLTTPQTALGDYTLILSPDIRDNFGNPLDQNQNLIAGETDFPGDHVIVNFRVTELDCFAMEEFGYNACVGTFENINLEVGQPGVFVIIPGCDDCFAPVNLGANTFSYYGTTYTGNNQLFVSSNGLVTFDSGNASFTNTNLTTSPPQRAIAVLWDDWINQAAGMVLGRFDGDRLIVEWNSVRGFGSPPANVTFQAVLRLNTGAAAGNVSLNYVDLNANDPSRNNGASATVGIKDTGNQGPRRILAHFNELNPRVSSGRAILITRLSAAPTPGTGSDAADLVTAATVLSASDVQQDIVQPIGSTDLDKVAVDLAFVPERSAGGRPSVVDAPVPTRPAEVVAVDPFGLDLSTL